MMLDSLPFIAPFIAIGMLVLLRLAYDAIQRRRKPPHEKLIEQLHRWPITILVGRKIECHACTLRQVKAPEMTESGLIVTSYVFEAHALSQFDQM